MGRCQIFRAHFIVYVVFDISLVGSEANDKHGVVGIAENKVQYNVKGENTLINISSLTCYTNQWSCGGRCIHKREYCNLTSQCNQAYPIPCGDETRCYRHVYIT